METLKARLADTCHQAHVVLTRNATLGLSVVLSVLRTAHRRQVIIPSLNCHALLAATHLAECDPVFADVRATDYNAEPADVDRLVTAETLAVFAVHAYGYLCPVNDYARGETHSHVHVIEDACLALGGRTTRGPAGGLAPVSVVSFGYDKPVSAGHGGAILCQDAHFARELQSMVDANPWLQPRDDRWGTEVITQLDGLGQAVRVRQYNAARLQRLSHPDLRHPTPVAGSSPWRHVAAVLRGREQLLRDAAAAGLVIPTHYRPLHRMQTQADCPVAETLDGQIVNFFVRPGTPDSYFERLAALLGGFGMTP